jgi:hypothetical protein
MKTKLLCYYDKRLVYVIVLCFLLLNVNATNTQVRLQYIPNQQGLLQKLIEIKYTSELYLSMQLKKEGLSNADRDTAFATYNTLRWKVDGFIYQISSEMIAANSPRKWRQLNEWCLNKKSLPDYWEALQEIENFYTMNIVPLVLINTKSINLSTNVFYLIKDSYSLVKGLSDLKTQKTMALIELLDHTRLLSVGEVVKMGVK